MPIYYFDVDDGTHSRPDRSGCEFKDRDEARDAALKVLPDVARQILPDGDRRIISSTIRDSRGKPIFRAVLSLSAVWLT